MSPPSPRARSQTSGDLLADRRYAYAEALLAEGDWAAAADLLRQVTDLAPRWIPAWMALGTAAERGGDRIEAGRAFAAAAALDEGGSFGAALHHARLRGERGLAAMPGAYVAALFDDYADRFDRHLVEGLAYQGPAAIMAALGRAGAPARFAHTLDLGCGTGLMGRAIRPRADRLDGVDISPAMLAQARRSGLYDALEVGDVVDALREAAGPRDLILAADVFVYLGALGDVLAACAQRLARGGLLAFTVQAGDEPHRLGDDLRFTHSDAYLREALATAGLAAAVLDPVSTRREAGQPVPGLVAVARKA